MKKGFTLIELLVVIAIISMLAGQIMPSLSSAREKGRQANCINNLHQIGISIEMYYQDYDDYPTWLSILVPSYLGTDKVFICLTDKYKGLTGHGNSAYPNSNDIPPSQIPGFSPPYPAEFAWRNPNVTACSYIYEFSPCPCEWFMLGYANGTYSDDDFHHADTNLDGVVSWKEAKMWQASNQGLSDNLPIVRCFWHAYNYGQKVLNLSYKDYHVFTSRMYWETTSD
ncbi:MAG TPA: type II secretion system protein [Candidatus Ratteibacteria bacterium]|nr:type II secretion system protein [bacterium]HRS05456.1 type II secretion system protein [Candidatus Ratteibacteria bacterium]HRV04462.1 type II secretion system protein [Candidatus Ratteibacteria bacterium]